MATLLLTVSKELACSGLGRQTCFLGIQCTRDIPQTSTCLHRSPACILSIVCCMACPDVQYREMPILCKWSVSSCNYLTTIIVSTPRNTFNKCELHKAPVLGDPQIRLSLPRYDWVMEVSCVNLPYHRLAILHKTRTSPQIHVTDDLSIFPVTVSCVRSQIYTWPPNPADALQS